MPERLRLVNIFIATIVITLLILLHPWAGTARFGNQVWNR